MSKKKESSFELLPIDQKAFDLAVRAWRMAALHHQRVSIEHSVDADEYFKMDEFSAPRVYRENEGYFASQLLEDARHVLGRAALGEAPSRPLEFLAKIANRKDFKSDKRTVAVYAAITAARDAMKRLPSGDERFIEAMMLAEKEGVV